MSAFWDKFKKNDKKEAAEKPGVEINADKKDGKEEKKATAEAKTGSEKKKKAKKIDNYKEKAQLVNQTVIRPIISEDAMNKEALAKYVFEVGRKATKKEIAKAVEAKYKVSVEKVNVLNYKQESHRFRNSVGRKKGFRKAIVTIKKGEKIELFTE